MLADTSIWGDYFRTLKDRQQTLALLRFLPQAVVASEAEVCELIEARQLFGLGIGWVDACLMASALLSQTPFWTRDRRLLDYCGRLKVAAGFSLDLLDLGKM